MRSSRLLLAAAAVLLTALLPTAARAATLEPVASFPSQVTGVTASKTGRIFVTFPRWTQDAPVSVAELLPDGSTVPYPDAAWNSWRNTQNGKLNPRTRFVVAQSAVVDQRDHLWVVDAGAPGMGFTVPGAPKLVEIDLSTNRVTRTIRFGTDVAPRSSYLNDVRFSPDGRWAYLTDSGAVGAIVVVDLRTGFAIRRLDGAPQTQPAPGVVPIVDGRELRRPDGRGLQGGSDGIALSPNGATLFFHALTGRTTYRVRTRDLRDPLLSPRGLRKRVRALTPATGVADGLLEDASGGVLVTQPEFHAVVTQRGGTITPLIEDPVLRWPDTLAREPSGSILVTDSRIPDSAMFNPQQDPSLPTTLYRIRP